MPEGVFGIPSPTFDYPTLVRRTSGLVLFWPGAGLGRSKLTTTAKFAMPAAHTLECWVKWTSVGANVGILSNWASSLGTMLMVQPSTSVLAFWTNGAGMSLGVVPTTGTWYHLVGTYDGTNRAAYLQGVLVAGPTAQAAPSASSTPLITRNYVGSGQPDLAGYVADAAIYSRALSAPEVAAHYRVGLNRA